MSHWLDDAPATEAAPSALQVVARRLTEVSPAWGSVTDAAAAAAGSRPDVARLGAGRAQGVESIREGWLLHRGASRVAAGASPDLALLVGDWCYAAGLCAIADEGTLDDVAALAQLVATVSTRAGEPLDALEPVWSQTIEGLHHG